MLFLQNAAAKVRKKSEPAKPSAHFFAENFYWPPFL